MYKNYLKRILDFFASLIGLLLLSPMFILVTIALFFVNQDKPFIFQKRPGRNEKIFSIIEFKSMNDKKDQNGNLPHVGDRYTSVESFLRKSSLDETPQLPNVLKGDKSLI